MVFFFSFWFWVSFFYDKGTENVKTDFSAGFLEFQGNTYQQLFSLHPNRHTYQVEHKLPSSTLTLLSNYLLKTSFLDSKIFF